MPADPTAPQTTVKATHAPATAQAELLDGAWHNGVLAAVERIESEADTSRDIGSTEHELVLRALAETMRCEFDLPPVQGDDRHD